jgi:hypothetical protein
MSPHLLRRSGTALSRTVGDAFYLARPYMTDVDVLRGTAAAIWIALEEGLTADEIVGTVAHTYAVPPETIEREVRSFISELRARGWVEEVDP